MEIAIIVGSIIFTFGYIILSTPGDNLRKKRSLFRTSLKSVSKEDENAFEFLNENGIKPCFLQKDLDNSKKINDMILGGRGIPPIGEVRELTLNEKRIQEMILNGEGIPPLIYNVENDDEYSLRLRRK